MQSVLWIAGYPTLRPDLDPDFQAGQQIARDAKEYGIYAAVNLNLNPMFGTIEMIEGETAFGEQLNGGDYSYRIGQTGLTIIGVAGGVVFVRTALGPVRPVYILDADGLTIRAEGQITGSHPSRGKGYRPTPEGGRAAGDHKGHLIPEGGVEDPKLVNVRPNMISEAPGSNLGPKKVVENFAIRLADQNPNSNVRMVLQPLRHPGQTRPHAVTVWVIQDGRTVHGVTIFNR